MLAATFFDTVWFTYFLLPLLIFLSRVVDVSLDTLRMVGTLTMDKGLWALIKASDGTIHRVKKGNYMGRNYGQIIRILDDRIELMEIVPDKPGTWREQQASLALAE